MAIVSPVCKLSNILSVVDYGIKRNQQSQLQVEKKQAQAYFVRKQRLEQDMLVFLKQLYKHNGFEYTPPKKSTQSFLDCYFNAVLKREKKEGKYRNFNYNKRNKTRRNAIRELSRNNFSTNNSAYITLTFAPLNNSTENIDYCMRHFKNFILRVNRRYDNLKYIATYSRQKNHQWHFHLLSNLIDITAKEIFELWGLGFINKSILKQNNDIHINAKIGMSKNFQIRMHKNDRI